MAEYLSARPRWLSSIYVATLLGTASAIAALAAGGQERGTALLLASGFTTFAAYSFITRVPRSPVPQNLPPRQRVFQGRQSELNELFHRHEKQRAHEISAPLIIALHGPPGVGKSMLAQELAWQISPTYSDGQLYSNLGIAGSMKAPAGILTDFLKALGWPASQIPSTAEESAKIFRSLTAGKKLLIVLDAARNAEQVWQVMPTAPSCTVIVTSRRDLGPLSRYSHSMAVAPPSFPAALKMLRTFTKTSDSDEPLAAVELVRLCGRLPIAIRATGDLKRDNEPRPLGRLADSLRGERNRLQRLSRSGRSIGDRFEAEYERLTPTERDALCRLARLRSETFVPWALIPLLDLRRAPESQREVEAIVLRLVSAQLLELAGPDPASGLDRFRFHPLVKVYVRTTSKMPRWAEASSRLIRDSLIIADRVLPHLYPDYTPVFPENDHPIPASSALYGQIAKHRSYWLRTEYLTLLQCAHEAYQMEKWSLSWRLAAMLRDPVPGEVTPGAMRRLFGVAHEAAKRDGHPLGALDVRLAEASALLAFGRHSQARQILETLVFKANMLRGEPDLSGEALIREFDTYRRLGEVHLRAGAHADAERELWRAKEITFSSAAREMGITAEVVDAMLGAISRPQAAHAGAESEELRTEDDDELAFWARLAAADRAQLGATQTGELSEVEQNYAGEGGRVAMALFRSARKKLRAADMAAAIRFAAQAGVEYGRLRDGYGKVRALSLLSIALTQVSDLESATEVLARARKHFRKLDGFARHPRSPLAAWLNRAEGHLAMSQGNEASSRALLRAAVEVFHDHGDRQSLAELAGLVSEFDLLDRLDVAEASDEREFQAWLETEQAIRVGRPLAACFAVGEAPRPRVLSLEEPKPQYGGGLISVEVSADRAKVEPGRRVTRLDPLQPLDTLRFKLTPTEAGDLRVRFSVYGAREGVLLQEFTSPTQPILEAVGQADD